MDKPENEDYFRSTENVKRVQQWRDDNPGYSQRKAATDETTLQDSLTREPSDNKDDTHQFTSNTLQDLLISQPPVLLGLISSFTEITLQENIVMSIRQMQKLGQDILNGSTTHNTGGQNDIKIPNSTRSYP